MAWIKLWNRKHTLQHDYFGRFLWFAVNPYYQIKNMMSVSVEKNKADFYCEEKEWNNLMSKLAKEVFQTGYLSVVSRRFLKHRRSFRRAALAANRPQELKRLSNKELLQRYKQIKKEHLRFVYFFFCPWAINQKIVPWFEQLLKRNFPSDYQKIFLAVTTPIKHNQMELQKLKLLKYKVRGELKKKIKHHVKKYGWLGVYSLLDKPFTKEFFLQQVKEVRNPRKVLNDDRRLYKERKKAFRAAMHYLRRNSKLTHIARILNEFAWFRTERVDVWREILFLLQPFYRELEKRIGLKKGQAPHLTYEEVVDFLKAEKVPDKKNVKPGAILYLRHGHFRVIRSRSEQKKILQKELGEQDYGQIKRIKGSVACAGRVRGKVKIVMVPEDCNVMKKGNILVSNMTHPDYIFGIKKAAAIVTDEGGISCHAAIVSREFGIPCIIGTKIATKVFKDGDLVDVDAERGIVRLIKRAKFRSNTPMY